MGAIDRFMAYCSPLYIYLPVSLRRLLPLQPRSFLLDHTLYPNTTKHLSSIPVRCTSYVVFSLL